MTAATSPPNIVTATRFWASSKEDLGRLGAFLDDTAPEREHIIVAVNIVGDKAGTVAYIKSLSLPNVEALPVRPWSTVMALNAIIHRAWSLGANFIMYQSIEVSLPRHSISTLNDHMCGNTLVAGVALSTPSASAKSPESIGDEITAHKFSIGEHELAGLTSPWNTAALWRLSVLSLTGFLAVADGYFGAYDIEEVAAIATLQHLARSFKVTEPSTSKLKGWEGADDKFSRVRNKPRLQPCCVGTSHGNKALAKLISIPGTTWKVDVGTSDKSERHNYKLSTKSPRAEAQLRLLGIPPGTVTHIASDITE